MRPWGWIRRFSAELATPCLEGLHPGQLQPQLRRCCAGLFEVCYVSANGGIRWNSDWINVSTICAGEYVGIEEIDDGIWNVYFGPLKLGRFHERHMRIEDEYGRLTRYKASPMSSDCFVTYLPDRSRYSRQVL